MERSPVSFFILQKKFYFGLFLLFIVIFKMTVSMAEAQIWDDFTVWYDGNGADSGHIAEVKYKSGTNEVILKNNENSSDGRDTLFKKKNCSFLGWSLDPTGISVIMPVLPGGTEWEPVDVPVTWDENAVGFKFYARWDCKNPPLIISPTATPQPEIHETEPNSKPTQPPEIHETEPNPKPTQPPMLILAPEGRSSAKNNKNEIQAKNGYDQGDTIFSPSLDLVSLKFSSEIDDLPYLPETGITGVPRSHLAGKPATNRLTPVNMELQIPTLGITSSIVLVEFINDSYSVELLDMNSGVLEGTNLPGEGFSVIAAHNTLDADTFGPFAMISAMEIGDHFFIRRSDNKLLIFEVYSNEKISKYDFESLYKFGCSYDNTVTLMTCEDEQTAGGYASRRIVSGKLIK